MKTEEQSQISVIQKMLYIPPAIEIELELEARAGSSLGLPDGLEGLGE